MRLLETYDFDDGIAKRKYKKLVGTSDATAVRDLTELVELGVPKTQGKDARSSISYLSFWILWCFKQMQAPGLVAFSLKVVVG